MNATPSDPRPLSREEDAALRQTTRRIRDLWARQLAERPDDALRFVFVSRLHHEIERVMRHAVEQGVALACRPGCSHCCRARVEASPPEVFRIASALRALPADTLAALVARMRVHRAGAGDAKRWQDRPPCPFLEDDLCAIYPLRPSACRRAHSLDALQCAASASEVPQSLKILAGVEALSQGVAGAYADVGLDARGHELVSAVLVALDDAEAAARWHAGGAPFPPPDAPHPS